MNLVESFNKITLKADKFAPEILTGLGVLSIIGGTALAIKATLKADEVMVNHRSRMDRIQEARAIAPDDYSEEDMKRDTFNSYVKTGFEFAKLFGPSIALETIGIGLTIGSTAIARDRLTRTYSALGGITSLFGLYRTRVSSELGEDMDYHYLTGENIDKKITIEEKDENGNKTKKTLDLSKEEYNYVKNDEKVMAELVNNDVFTKIFDSSSREWVKDPTLNMSFLIGMQNMLNDKLIAKGHLFLNDVYDALDMPRTSMGAIYGWLREDETPIDFGIWDAESEAGRRFINGLEPNVWLRFNPTGIIYDKI